MQAYGREVDDNYYEGSEEVLKSIERTQENFKSLVADLALLAGNIDKRLAHPGSVTPRRIHELNLIITALNGAFATLEDSESLTKPIENTQIAALMRCLSVIPEYVGADMELLDITFSNPKSTSKLKDFYDLRREMRYEYDLRL